MRCPDCNGVVSVSRCGLCGGSGFWDDPDSGYDYYEDEWYAEEDDARISEWSVFNYVGKAANGHLYTRQVVGYCYYGQDWGMTHDYQWETETYRLKELKPNVRRAALRIGRLLEPGKESTLYWHEKEMGKYHTPSAAYFVYRRPVWPWVSL